MARQLLQSHENIVVAACRNPSKADALQTLKSSADGRLHIIQLDANDAQSIKEAARTTTSIVGEKGVDYLVNNAAIVSRS